MTNTDDKLLSEREFSEYAGLAPGVAGNWRCQGRGPRYVKCGRWVRYRMSDIREWLDAHTRESTAERCAA